MTFGRLSTSLAILTIASAANGCSGRSVNAKTEAQSRSNAGEVPSKSPYPAGRWRLAPRSELSRSVVWLSHVVIMHRDSKPHASGLRPNGWAPETLPDRSRQEAYRIAVTAQTELRNDPSKFPGVARRYSDDVVSREQGGSLGGVHVMDLAAPILDALAALQPGQVSEVFESPMGFHVVLSRRPPPLATVTGAHVLVGYGGHKRTRAEALARAAELEARAKSGGDFEELARSESEEDDSVRGGFMGVWSTREPSPANARLLESLAGLPVGGVSDPVDSPNGFHVLKRLPAREPIDLAMRAVKIPALAVATVAGVGKAADDPDNPYWREAARIAGALRKDPFAFSRFTDTRCCRVPERWSDGHGDPVVTSTLEKLRVGEVTKVPIDTDDYFIVAQRLDPDLVAAPEKPILGLPLPSTIDLEDAVRANDNVQLASEVAQLTSALDALGLAKPARTALVRELDQFRADLPNLVKPEARVDAFRQKMEKIHAALSESDYARVLSMSEAWASQRMLAPSTT